jgi:hypothetical protein
MRKVLLVVVCAGGGLACGGSQPRQQAEVQAVAEQAKDPHRKLTADECGVVFDFMKEKGWFAQPDAQRDAVVAGCLEMGATQAFQQCILGSTTREDADRCQ